jgi:predicted dehydrogenase
LKHPLRLAIIGLGYWGPNLVRNFNLLPECEVAACCDLNEDRWNRLKNQYRHIHFTTSIDAILTDPTLDAVVIATPVRTHYELVKRALDAGKHVLVEKPLATEVAQARELVDLAERKGLVLQVDHVFVYSPAVAKIAELVRQGHLGKLFYVDSVRINLGLFQHDVNVLWDLAPHDISILDCLLGRLPVSLSACGASHTANGLEDVAYLNLDFGDGLMANFHVNWLSPVKIRHILIGGSERSLVYNDLDPAEKIRIYDRGVDVSTDESLRKVLISYRTGDMRSPKIASEEPLALMALDFVRSIQNGSRPLADGASALRVVTILAAAEQSIRNGGQKIAFDP